MVRLYWHLLPGALMPIGLLGFEHQAVSHVSGTATLFGNSMLTSSFGDILHLAGVLLCIACTTSVPPRSCKT